MKNARLLFACILYIICMSAQSQTLQFEYRPFAQDGKTWETQVRGIKENIYGNRIDGDTVINGEIWKKVYNYIGFPDFNNSYYAAIRDMGRKVYAIVRGSNRPRLLYDFDLEVGNMVRCGVEGNAFGCLLDKDQKPDTLLGFPFVSYLRVERIDTIKARGIEHRRFTLSLLDAFQEYYRNGEEAVIGHVVWVEGVGSGAGPFSPWMPLPPRDCFSQKCEMDRTCIFGYPDFYDADISNAVYNPQSVAKKSTQAYDLQGRLLPSLPQTGVFIQNGKKVVVK